MINIEKRVLSKKFIKMYHKVFDDFVLNTCLDNGAWIAGGFARKISLVYNRIDNNFNSYRTDPVESLIKYFHKESGDIDIFVKSNDMLNDLCDKIGIHSSNEETFGNIINFENSGSKKVFISPFALNVHAYENYNFNNKNLKSFPLQIVNKFMFETIEDCFKSFDITNCMYAISKVEDQYILHYEKKALELDKTRKIEVNHNNSPYLGNRLYKYSFHKGLTVSESARNKKILKEYYYKIVSNVWPDVYNIRDTKEFNKCSMQNMSKVVKMSANDLSIFIGKFMQTNFRKVSKSGYGFHLIPTEVDWALDKINNPWS